MIRRITHKSFFIRKYFIIYIHYLGQTAFNCKGVVLKITRSLAVSLFQDTKCSHALLEWIRRPCFDKSFSQQPANSVSRHTARDHHSNRSVFMLFLVFSIKMEKKLNKIPLAFIVFRVTGCFLCFCFHFFHLPFFHFP